MPLSLLLYIYHIIFNPSILIVNLKFLIYGEGIKFDAVTIIFNKSVLNKIMGYLKLIKRICTR